MPRCPNCAYILVLLEHRGKYKCAKCSKLFLQKEIDDKEFREWNKQQKGKDEEDYKRQLKLRRKSLKPRKIVDPIVKQKKLQEYRTIYYTNNKDKILAQKKEYRKVAKEKQNIYKKAYRAKNDGLTQILSRIHYWRQMQKGLIIKINEFIQL